MVTGIKETLSLASAEPIGEAIRSDVSNRSLSPRSQSRKHLKRVDFPQVTLLPPIMCKECIKSFFFGSKKKTVASNLGSNGYLQTPGIGI